MNYALKLAISALVAAFTALLVYHLIKLSAFIIAFTIGVVVFVYLAKAAHRERSKT